MKKKICISFIMIVLFLLILPSQVGALTDISNKLSGMSIKTLEVNPGGKVYVELTNLDSSVNQVNIYMLVEEIYLTIEVKDIHNNPYFDMPTNAIPGRSYNMGMIEIIDNEGNRKTYSTNELNYGNKTIKVMDISIKNLSIKGDNILTKKDKLYLDLEITENVDFVTVSLKNDDAKGILVSINDIKTNPYIDLDVSKYSTQQIYEGEYYISDIFLNPNDSTKYVHYSKDLQDKNALQLDFDVNFTIKGEEENVVDNSNENISNELTNEISKEQILTDISYKTLNNTENEKKDEKSNKESNKILIMQMTMIILCIIILILIFKGEILSNKKTGKKEKKENE